ncbi:MAG: hypothetical protein JW954_06670, partial [Dehalococcoidaceae bacterium]|nr:hypothetical protein [Dehalococcoidaceae bacterium]
MKNNKLIKIMSSLFALVIFLAAIPAVSVAAAVPVVNLSPTFGPVGTTVTVSGTSFENNATYQLCISNQSINLEANISTLASFGIISGTVDTNSAGVLPQTQFVIPNQLTSGILRNVNAYESLYVYVAIPITDDLRVKGKAEFRVTGNIDVDLSPTQGNVGQELEIEGEGFWPGEDIQIL